MNTSPLKQEKEKTETLDSFEALGNYVYTKREKKGKGGKKNSQNLYNQFANKGENSGKSGLQMVFKWLPIESKRISPAENKDIYHEYKQVRAKLLKDTVYNSDGTENVEGIARLRQAGLSDKVIFETVGEKGETPNGYNYHHILPRSLSGSLKKGPIQFGDCELSTIHDWRAMIVLPCDGSGAIHENVHSAMDKRNGDRTIKRPQGTSWVPVPLNIEEMKRYKENPASLGVDLLVVAKGSYNTIEVNKDKTAEANQDKTNIVANAILQKRLNSH